MLEKFFKKTEKKQENDKVLIASLLVHAAKIDENYTEEERTIIKKAMGKDITKLWWKVKSHNSSIISEIFPKYIIGRLKVR